MTSKTNQARAGRGLAAVTHHTVALLGNDPDDLPSLLADLLHFCGETGTDFELALATAREHFAAEVGGCDDWMDEPVPMAPPTPQPGPWIVKRPTGRVRVLVDHTRVSLPRRQRQYFCRDQAGGEGLRWFDVEGAP